MAARPYTPADLAEHAAQLRAVIERYRADPCYPAGVLDAMLRRALEVEDAAVVLAAATVPVV